MFSTSLLLRTSVTVCILVALGILIDFSEMKRIFRSLEYLWIFWACSFILTVRFIGALRWQHILASQKIEVPLGRLFRIISLSIPIGRFLPIPESTDLVKGYHLIRYYGQRATVAGTIITDRFIGFYATVFTACIGVFVALYVGISKTIIFYLLALNLVFIAGGVLVLRLVPKLTSIALFEETRFQGIWSKILFHLSTITDKKLVKATYPRIFSLSLLASVARCAIYYCLYRSLGEVVSFLYFLIFIPLVAIVLLLPLSLGGVGVRELSLVYLFGTTGVSAETSISAGILLEFLHILTAVPAFTLFILGKREFRFNAK